MKYAASDVAAKVETLRVGDAIALPTQPPRRRPVAAVLEYDDGTIVVEYLTGERRPRYADDDPRWTAGAGSLIRGSLASMPRGTRVRCRRLER